MDKYTQLMQSGTYEAQDALTDAATLIVGPPKQPKTEAPKKKPSRSNQPTVSTKPAQTEPLNGEEADRAFFDYLQDHPRDVRGAKRAAQRRF
jgi:hypothetical protein